jgi:hypothetical protein
VSKSVTLDDKRVGTVNGDLEFGFTARDMDYYTISRATSALRRRCERGSVIEDHR